MLGELNQDIMGEIGTNPKYPQISNLDWLTVDTAQYDNYPSDNESVNIKPKLADLWNHNRKECGINLIPNQTVQSLGLRSADEDNSEAIANFCRETKKAMMMGHTGTKLAEYLRARFDKKTIEASKEEMVKLSEEQGLIGNVYVDASAFSSSRDAEQFLTAHRSRLAQDILINDSVVDHNVIGYLANRLHKNVVASINYSQDLFDKYKIHLVEAGNIGPDHVIDSKESLRLAFLSKYVPEIVKTAKSKNVKRATKEEIAQELSNRIEKEDTSHRLAAMSLAYRNVRPIVEFTRVQLVKGKSGNDLKEMLRGKYAQSDLNDAVKYIAVVISHGVTPERINKLVEANKIPEKVGDDLKEMIKTHPLKVKAFEDYKPERQVGIKGSYHVLSGNTTDNLSEYHEASVESLRKGKSFDQLKSDLLGKLSNEEADKVLLVAVKAFNESPAGVTANAPVIQPKKKLVADLKEHVTLPKESTIVSKSQEVIDFYKGAEMVVEVDEKSSDTGLLDVKI